MGSFSYCCLGRRGSPAPRTADNPLHLATSPPPPVGPLILWGYPASPSPLFPHIGCFVFMGFLSHPVLSCFISYRISSLTATSSMKPSFTVQPLLISGTLRPRALVLCGLVFSCAPSSGAGGCVPGIGASLLNCPWGRDMGGIHVSGTLLQSAAVPGASCHGAPQGLRWAGEETGRNRPWR